MQIIPIKRSNKSRAQDTKAGFNPEERKKENARGVVSGGKCRYVIIAWLAFQAACWDDCRIPESNSKS